MQDDRQTHTSKAIVKFIDLIIDLYSPVPYQIRNEMRILQNTLLYGRNKQLEQYLDTLKQKLQLKQKHKHHQLYAELPTPIPTLQKSASKTGRNPLSDSDKQNRFYLNNLRVNVSENIKKIDSSLNVTTGDLPKNRKISAVEYINRQEQNFQQFKPNNNSKQELGRHPSRTLLKIVKKNRSSKQKQPLTERSLDQQLPKSIQHMKSNVDQILMLMSKNQSEFNLRDLNCS